jgi:hypothetical protein
MLLVHFSTSPLPMTLSRDMQPTILNSLVIDQELVALANRVCDADFSDTSLEIEYLVNEALGLPQTAKPTTSLDVTLAYLREHFPQPEWRYGFQDAGYKVYTGPTAWLANGRCQRTGFDNQFDLEYRYFERSARTIEAAFLALALLATAHKPRV